MSETRLEQFLLRIESREATIGIIGMGYVGLPLALVFHDVGFPVIGFDVDPRKIEALHRGETYIRHIGADRVAAAFGVGNTSANKVAVQGSTDFGRLSECDAILICVPTPLGDHRDPELLETFVSKGAITQITASSLTGEFGRPPLAASQEFFRRGLVHLVASDAHNLVRRPPRLAAARERVRKDWGEEVERALFEENPRAVIEGRDLVWRSS